jgi:membrane glycosyltransferase
MEFARRDVRWCQGNMQYLRLLGWPNLRPISRMQVLFAIIMYIGSLSWVLFAALAFAMLIADTESGFAYRLQLFLLLIYVLTLTPKLAGLADTLVTASAARRYGGRLRLLAGALTEAFFSLILAPILTLRAAIFMAGLPLGLAVRWDGQQRDPRRVRWAEAARCFWFETAVGFACFALLASFAPDMLVWPFPMLAGLVLSIPFAVLSASSWAGRLMTSAKLCAIPEEFDEPSILDTIRKGRISVPAEAL